MGTIKTSEPRAEVTFSKRLYDYIENIFVGTQEDFCKRLNLSPSFFSRIKGMQKVPPFSMLIKISRFTGIPINHLIEEVKANRSK